MIFKIKRICALALWFVLAFSPLSAVAENLGTSLGVTAQSVNAQTSHNEITNTDAVMTASSPNLASASASFASTDVGKSIVVNGAGTSGADLVTTISAVTDATHVVLAANAATTVPWYTAGRALYSTASTLSGSYVIGDVLTVSGGTKTTAGQFTIVSVGVGSATVNAAGSGGTNGSCTLTGTTGVTRTGGTVINNVYTGGWFTATVTISGGAISGAVTIVTSGDYSTAPTSLSAEPVTSNCNLTGATLTLKMAPHFVQQTVAGQYTVLPSNPVSTTGGTGGGAQLTISADQPGGYYAYGTDDTAAINDAIASVITTKQGGVVQLPCGKMLMLGAMQIPYTGTTNPTQNPLRITGCGEIANGQWQPVSNGGNPGIAPFGVSGTILDMRFSGDAGTHVAKIDTRGGGRLELDHFTMADLGTDNFQFIQTTNTTLSIHDFMMSGNATCWQMTCQQNGISFGGLTTASHTINTNASTAGFQGYRTQIYNVQVENMQEAFQFGGAANIITFNNVNGGVSNGSYSSNSGFYTFYGVGVGGSFGTTNNTIFGGNLEAAGYIYPIVMKSNGASNQSNAFYSIDIVDANLGLPTVGAYSLDANSKFNLIISSAQVAQLAQTYVTQVGNVNTFMTTTTFAAGGQSGQPTMWPTNMVFPGKISLGTTQQVYPVEIGANNGQVVTRFNGGASGNGCGPALYFAENGSNFGYIGIDSAISGGACNQNMRVQGSQINLNIFNNNKATIDNSRISALEPVRLFGYTVSTLPSGSVGDTAYVTDATACTYGGALTGSGSTACKVWYNGAAWVGN